MSYTKHLREDQFNRIAAALPGYTGRVGRPVEDNRRFVEAVVWMGRNGGRWRSLPAEYGKWSSAHKRFKRWADAGIWQMIFNTLVEDADMEWVMIDSTIVRAHQHATGAKKGIKTRL
jgi:putative transposase